ncbi:Zinc finger matrin-type protein 2 [Psilocybe cubensis]|uniref:Zinc finger matrin-type protein 2 n=2 Tax=Psilocybe cubensis TaxID=181762 RepID=A0ACB8HAZ8_PSICU|nr:Zinc finger matrin-type protein 2 [Psilocybe cubensis]KAH9485106.1 Zinc finger matrin-type protein 2 [Psilocybe cubensis]
MADKGGAYGTKAADTDFRKKWDKEEYAERAKKKDQEERERMQENEERMKKGKRPLKGRKDDLPKPTQLMQQREAPLELDKNLGKTMVVQNPGGKGPGQPGFYCETCNRTYKDSVGYLDHINSRAHLRALGQTTKIERSTLAQVQARIAYLREKTKEAASAKAFDFDQRLAEVREKEREIRENKKAERKAEKEKARLAMIQDDGDSEMAALMGFGGFGSTKK